MKPSGSRDQRSEPKEDHILNVTETGPDEASNPVPSCSIEVVEPAVQQSQNTYRPRNNSTYNPYVTKRKMEKSTSQGAIQARLAQVLQSHDLLGMTCGESMCGRVFDSLPVLAYHVSYAHQDLSYKNGYLSSMCLVCGLVLQSPRGRNIHLMSRHRDLANDHNSQCLEQRESVISPLAPAAQRLHLENHPAYVTVERYVPMNQSNDYHYISTSQEIQ